MCALVIYGLNITVQSDFQRSILFTADCGGYEDALIPNHRTGMSQTIDSDLHMTFSEFSTFQEVGVGKFSATPLAPGSRKEGQCRPCGSEDSTAAQMKIIGMAAIGTVVFAALSRVFTILPQSYVKAVQCVPGKP